MALDDKDLSKIAKQLMTELGKLTKNTTPFRSAGSSPRRTTKAMDELEDSMHDASEVLDDLAKAGDNLADTIRELNETSKYADSMEKGRRVANEKYADVLKSAQDSIIASLVSFKKVDAAVNLLEGDLVKQAKAVQNNSNLYRDLDSSMAKTIRASSVFGASLLRSHDMIEKGSVGYNTMISSLTNASKPLNRGILKAAGAWDKNADSVKEGLGTGDFSRLRVAIGNAETTIANDLGKLGFNSVAEVMARAKGDLQSLFEGGGEKELKAAMIGLAAKLETQGVDLGLTRNGRPVNVTNEDGSLNAGVVKSLKGSPELMEKLVLSIGSVQAANKAAFAQYNAEIFKSSTYLGRWYKGLQDGLGMFSGKMGLVTGMLDKLALGLTIEENLRKTKAAFGDLYKQVMDFNVAHVPASFVETSLASIKLGMSFDETVKFMQENKRAAALYGDSFSDYTGQLKGTFQKFGYTMKQGAELVGPTFEAAINSGVDVSNKNEVQNYLDGMLKSFNRISSVVNISATDFIKLNSEITSLDGVQQRLLGMSKDQEATYRDSIKAQTENYLALGLSTGQIENLMRAQEAQQRQGVVDQLRNAAKQQLAGQLVGMSGQDTSRLSDLANNRARTTDENNEYLALQAKFNQLQASARQNVVDQYGGGSAQLKIFDTQMSSLAQQGPSADVQNSAERVSVLNKANAGVSDSQIAAAQKKAQPDQTLAAVGNVVNSVKSALDNNLTKAIFGTTASMLGLMWQARRAATALGMIGGGGGGLVSGIVNGFKGGGGIKGALKGGLSGLIGLGGGLAAEAAPLAETVESAVGGTAAKVGGEETVKAGEKVAEKVGGEEALKVGGKFLGKDLLKKIPGIGLLAGGVFAGQRALEGDWGGAGLELASGAASTVPGLGTAASFGIDGLLAARDLGVFGKPTSGSSGIDGASQGLAGASQQPQVMPPTVQPPTVTQASSDASQQSVNTADSSQAGAAKQTATPVEDTQAHDILADIVNKLTDAVTLLQQVADNGTTEQKSAATNALKSGIRPIPTSTGYASGRMMA